MRASGSTADPRHARSPQPMRAVLSSIGIRIPSRRCRAYWGRSATEQRDRSDV
eukprot:CAMPEP_0181170888 /NCGR_PEP_ID=MMETSP1096-20121128/1607_1 /TAXON_ID=156174 ORGANISM="Chrysochromulina ericina, Strain CCMP281" /NCGR_SAMPLE_ID=MMETSP1096 /ASSEMBLY_ACC=CAM_ASM_000453 /LENGTH=52 /DNA_ID=CAMNT_0023258481 /DNA_START=341 /DNA_END=495 /DNA_ORIENTATION=+